GFPSLSRRLQASLELPPATRCFDLAALGCAGATQGWWLAHALMASRSVERVCVLLVDVMGTFAQCRRHTRVPAMEQLVAHCLASDGASALSLGRDWSSACALRYGDARLDSRLWPGSLHLNDLTSDRDNMPYLSVGGDIRSRVLAELAHHLDEESATRPIFFHPGGAALMHPLVAHHPPLNAPPP